MANFATLADALSGCVTRVAADACSKLFAAATPPKGGAPTDTLTAAQSIARYPWYQPERLYALLDQFYPVPKGKNLRAVPYMPYLNWAPSAWVLPLKFDGGGYRAGGKAMFDSEGNLWLTSKLRGAPTPRIDQLGRSGTSRARPTSYWSSRVGVTGASGDAGAQPRQDAGNGLRPYSGLLPCHVNWSTL